MGRAELESNGTSAGVTSDLAIDALAAYRLTRLITEDRAPFGPARDWVLRRWPNSVTADWVSCAWCSGLWIAAGVTVVRSAAPRWWPPAATALALSAATGLLSTWENR